MRSNIVLQELAKNPKDPDLLVRLGRKLYGEQHYDQALIAFFRATENAPDNPRIFAFIGSTLKRMQLHSEAARYFSYAFKGGYKRPTTLENLIYSLRISGKSKQARDLATRFSQSDLLTPNVANLLAMDNFTRSNFDASRQFLDKAIEADADNLFYQSLKETLQAVSADHGNKRKIGFHLNETFHYHIMKPIFDALKDEYHCLMTADLMTLADFKPEVVFVANSQAKPISKYIPDACFIYTRHGLISKNFVFNAIQGCDYVCVSSSDQKREFVKRGGIPEDRVWITGYAQMDPLFQKATKDTGLQLDGKKPTILYAPTFTPGLSSIPAMTKLMTDQPDQFDDMNVIMKLHPLAPEIYPKEVRALHQLCQNKENMHFVRARRENIVDYLAHADLLVSDVSSVVFQYLALDRPVVTINNPDRFKSPQYDRDGLEWKWRDMGEEVDQMADLLPVINRALENPTAKQEIRSKYRDLLFGDVTDGQTGLRVKENLAKYFEQRAREAV